jgi:hypothetical protein
VWREFCNKFILPDENVHIQGLNMLVHRPKNYLLFSGLIPRGVTFILQGMSLTQPFADLGKQGSIKMVVSTGSIIKIIPLTFRTT